MLYVLIVLIALEAVAFAIATVLHFGVTILGFRDTYGIPEGVVQGSIALLLAICAYGMWKRAIWARAAGFVVHGIGLAGALFGIAVARKAHASLEPNPYDLVRLAMLVAVPILLLLPAARTMLQPRRQ